MNRAEKEAIVQDVRRRFERATSAVFVDFEGMRVASVTELRDELRKAGVEYQVVKNTLVRLALGARAQKLDDVLTRTTAIAWSYEEPSTAARVLRDYGKKNDKLKVKAGLLEETVLDGQAVVTQLASMPGKQELRAKLLATMQAPLQKFLQLLQTPSQNFAYLLKAREEQLSRG
jgi:large subunit ribosomal protein L10